MVEMALAAADAAEVEAQRRKAPVHEGVEQVVDDLVVHRPAELRVRVQDYGERRAALLGGLVAALDPAGRSVENHLWHRRLAFCWAGPDATGFMEAKKPSKSRAALDGPAARALHQSA